MKVCPWCAEELADDALRCTRCGHDPSTRPVPRRRDLGDGAWWGSAAPDPATVFDNPGRPRPPADKPSSDLRLLEPSAGREQPLNANARRSTWFAAFGSPLFALFFAKRAEKEIEDSNGREGGMEFVQLARIIVFVSLGTAALAIAVAAVMSAY